EKVAIAGSPHVVFEPAGDVIGIAADDETVVAHLLEGGVGAGEVALDMLAMVEGAVGVESGERGRIGKWTAQHARQIGDGLLRFFDSAGVGFGDMEQARADETVGAGVPAKPFGGN